MAQNQNIGLLGQYLTVSTGNSITFSSNVTLTSPLIANSSPGTATYVLTSNGNIGSPYWSIATSAGGNVNAVQSNLVSYASTTNTTIAILTGNIANIQVGITGSNTNITNLTTGLIGANTNITILTGNIANLQAGLAGANASGVSGNVNAVQANLTSYAAYANSTFSGGGGGSFANGASIAVSNLSFSNTTGTSTGVVYTRYNYITNSLDTVWV